VCLVWLCVCVCVCECVCVGIYFGNVGDTSKKQTNTHLYRIICAALHRACFSTCASQGLRPLHNDESLRPFRVPLTDADAAMQ
jgi:hypothetical protein